MATFSSYFDITRGYLEEIKDVPKHQPATNFGYPKPEVSPQSRHSDSSSELSPPEGSRLARHVLVAHQPHVERPQAGMT